MFIIVFFKILCISYFLCLATKSAKYEKITVASDVIITPVTISFKAALYVNNDGIPSPILVAIFLSIISLISEAALPTTKGKDKITIFLTSPKCFLLTLHP